ncbi:hypothetical protein GPECTOR_14g50 [Gonium pectorale]|uniref:Uncharacterized protein n=1 Tax=Gonium pectorale TaxID=33097 RepID=A0A150GMR7_GONPE|nr:hypothetical protein GPECTOR_14g50 [Gonium pectorale]|eukprot:KXZ51065.1 hypothetical protein GPECTOR_14g50 [Gonium pectorale]
MTRIKNAHESDEAPKWKTLLTSAAAGYRPMDRRIAEAAPLAAAVKAVLSEHSSLQPEAQKLFTALDIGTLNTCVAGLDPEDTSSLWQLLAVNDTISSCEQRLTVVLVEHQFLNALSRLHKR